MVRGVDRKLLSVFNVADSLRVYAGVAEPLTEDFYRNGVFHEGRLREISEGALRGIEIMGSHVFYLGRGDVDNDLVILYNPERRFSFTKRNVSLGVAPFLHSGKVLTDEHVRVVRNLESAWKNKGFNVRKNTFLEGEGVK